MRIVDVFVILAFVAVTCADKLGYNYQPVADSDEGLSFLSGQPINQLFEESALQQAPAPTQLLPEYQKEFFSFAAPDEAFDDNGAAEKIASAIKKSLRVVFIKAPENKGLEQAALSLIQQSSDDHTAIYVLAKQTDIGDLAQRLQTETSQSQSKPEVHFVKYRTPQDAVNAQRTIEEQYNALPGSSRSQKAEQASVFDFANPTESVVSTASLKQAVAVEQQYLPPAPTVRRREYLSSATRRRFRV